LYRLLGRRLWVRTPFGKRWLPCGDRFGLFEFKIESLSGGIQAIPLTHERTYEMTVSLDKLRLTEYEVEIKNTGLSALASFRSN